MVRARGLVALALATACLGRTACAQDAQLPAIVVNCVDGDGRPVAGAAVHVFQFQPTADGSRLVPAGPFASGTDGSVRTAVALTWGGGRYDRWVYAVVPGKLVGATRRWPGVGGDGDRITVQLTPSRSLQGRVRVPAGCKASDVCVRVLSLQRGDDVERAGDPFPRQHSFALRDVLPERFDCRVAEDGTFTLADLPTQLRLYLAAEGPGFAQTQFSNVMSPGRVLPEQIEMSLERESVLAGKVLGPDGKPAAGATVKVRISGPRVVCECTFAVRADGEGAFSLGGLPATTLLVQFEAPGAVFRPRRLDIGIAQRIADFAATMETPIEVTGVVVAAGDGKPVERAGIGAVAQDHQTSLGGATTDALGRFTLRLPRGEALIYFGGLPEGFVDPVPQIVATLDVGVDKPELLRLELVRKPR